MPKPRKKIKHLEVSSGPDDRDQDNSSEDFVGKFLVGAFTALVAALISQAATNQINWGVVALATVAALLVLAAYQKRKG